MKSSDKQKIGLIEKLLAGGLLVVFALIAFHAPLSVWLGTLGDADLVIKAWKELLLLAMIPLAILVLSRRPDVWNKFKKDPLVWLIVAYGLLHIAYVLLPTLQLVPFLAGLAIDLRYLLFFLLVYISALSIARFRAYALRTAFIAAALAMFFAVLQVFFFPPDILSKIGYGKDTIEPYLTIDKNEDFVRINGTLRGPNPLGAYVVLFSALTAAYLLLHKGKLHTNIVSGAVLVMAPAVLWASYSRSAWAAAVLAVGLLVFFALQKKVNRAWLAALIIGPMLVLGTAAYTLRNSEFFVHVIEHRDPQDAVQDNSNDGHLASLSDGLHRTLTEPFGSGPGSTGSASLLGDQPVVIENQYLFIAHEAGWLALALFLAIFVLILYGLWQLRYKWLPMGVLASGIGLALIGILLPVWVDDTVSILWFGFAALALASHKFSNDSP